MSVPQELGIINTEFPQVETDAQMASKFFIIKRLGTGTGYSIFYPSRHLVLICDEGNFSRSVEIGFSSARVLELLISRSGSVVEREEIIKYAWPRRFVTQSSLNQAVKSIREVLGDELTKQVIQTVPRHGYQFNPDSFLQQDAPSLLLDQVVEPEKISARWPASMTRLLPWIVSILVFLVLIVVRLSSSDGDWGDEVQAQGIDLKVSKAPDDSTKSLRDRLLRLAPEAITIVVDQQNGLYEIICIKKTGEKRVILIHSSLISTISDDNLRKCIG